MRWCACPVILLGAALAGCTGSGLRPASASYPTKEWLVGGWVLEGDSCASDAGVLYRIDGSWAAEDMAGKWELRRGDLLLEVTQGAKPGLPEAPRSYHEQIEVRGPDEFVARRGDGSTQIMKRCVNPAAERQ